MFQIHASPITICNWLVPPVLGNERPVSLTAKSQLVPPWASVSVALPIVNTPTRGAAPGFAWTSRARILGPLPDLITLREVSRVEIQLTFELTFQGQALPVSSWIVLV